MTTAAPAISVILPTYNRARSLSRAVDSVLSQTFRDFELIVVDDASTDGSLETLGGVDDPRVRCLRLDRNRGAAGARNAGIATARADWIAFQDSDDVWLPTKLEQQYCEAGRVADRPAGLVLGGYLARQPSGEDLHVAPQSVLRGGSPMADVLDGWPIITPTWLVERRLLLALGGFDERYPCLEDWDLILRLSDRCAIRAVPGPVLVKHGSFDSVCADPQKLRQGLERILQHHEARWAGEPVRLSRRLAHLGVLQHRLGARARALRSLVRACLQAPAQLPPYVLLAAALCGGRFLGAAGRRFPHYAGMSL